MICLSVRQIAELLGLAVSVSILCWLLIAWLPRR